MTSKIEWTESTWNFLGGCDEISPGCANCYAKYHAHRLAQNPNEKVSAKYKDTTKIIGIGETKRVVWTAKINFDEESLLIPLKTKKPTTFFISMSDLFFEEVKDEWIDKAFAVMSLCQQHTFQILTKRASRMSGYFKDLENLEFKIWGQIKEIAPQLFWKNEWKLFPLKNCWLGVSVENQKEKPRIDILRDTPAAIRFLSLEPLLEDLGELNLSGIDLVIIGGESGSRARAFYLEHGLDIIRQCRNSGVPVFFKQAGAFCVTENVNLFDFPDSVKFEPWGNAAASCRIKFKDKKGGDLEELPKEFRIREFPQIANKNGLD